MAEAGSSPAKRTSSIADAVEKAFRKNGIALADSRLDGDSGMFAIGFSGFFGGNLRYVAAVSGKSDAGYSDFHIRTAGLFMVPAGLEGQAVNLCNSLNLSHDYARFALSGSEIVISADTFVSRATAPDLSVGMVMMMNDICRKVYPELASQLKA
ncbi:MAG: hypothetical protein II152_03285 [Succinivibrionaceae bacterium]|nr:hypothetical protein [Succinivibrionaceae bacterium]